jgi:hypothetical protein
MRKRFGYHQAGMILFPFGGGCSSKVQRKDDSLEARVRHLQEVWSRKERSRKTQKPRGNSLPWRWNPPCG